MVDLREDPVKGVVITNLTEVVVGNLRQTMEQLEQGKLLKDVISKTYLGLKIRTFDHVQ